MSTSGERIAALEAIAFGTDPRISPDNRMKAMEALERLETPGKSAANAAMMALANEVGELTGEALDAELAGHFTTGWDAPPPPPPGSEEAIEEKVESRFRRAIKLWAKANGVRLEPSQPEPDRVAAQAPPEPVTSARPATEDELAKRRAHIHVLDGGERIDLAADMTGAQRSIAMSKIARQDARTKIAEEKRQRSVFRDHIPYGMSPQDWEQCWP